MAIDWMIQRLGYGKGTTGVMLTAVVFVLTTVTCVASTVSSHGHTNGPRSSQRTTVAFANGAHGKSGSPVTVRQSHVSTSAAPVRTSDEPAGVLDAPRECDLHKGIDTSCVYF